MTLKFSLEVSMSFAFGDFFQLPPVRDIFQEGNGYNPGSTDMWKDIFTMVELTINMRQMGDNTYSQVLGRTRTGQQTPDDVTAQDPSDFRYRYSSGC